MAKSDASTVLILSCCGTNGSTITSDTGPSARAVTFSGSATISTTQSKFDGSSLYVNGSGNYVTVPDSADWNMGAGDFVWDAWIYLTSLAANNGIMGQGSGASSRAGLWVDTSGEVNFEINDGTDQGNWITTTASISTSTWTHVAVVRSGSSTLIYVDGVSQSVTETTALGTYPDLSAGLDVGRCHDGSGLVYCSGYVDNARIVKGSDGGWGSDFTPPTSSWSMPRVYPEDPVLLLNFEGADGDTTTTDASASAHTITLNGGARIDGDLYRYGCSALELSGSGQWGNIADSADFEFGTGDFTIDFWFYQTTGINSKTMIAKADSASYAPFRIDRLSGKLRLFMSTTGSSWAVNLAGTTTLNAGQWYHCAVTRSGTTVRLFLDGAVENSTTYSASPYNNTDDLLIGRLHSAFTSYDWNGTIAGVRIVKGTAAWSGTFTPPGPYKTTAGATSTRVAALRDRLVYPGARVGILRDRLVLDGARVGILRDRLVRPGARVGVLRDRLALNRSRVGALRDRGELTRTRVGILRDRLQFQKARVALLRHRFLRDGWAIYVDGVFDQFIEDDGSGGPFASAFISLSPGDYTIEARPSKWFWEARNLDYLRAEISGGGTIQTTPPPVEAFADDFVEGESELNWTYAQGFGYSTPTAFKLWFSPTTPVPTGPTPDATITARGAGVSHRYRRAHTATEYVAISVTDGTLETTPVEYTLTVGSTPPPAPENVRATP